MDMERTVEPELYSTTVLVFPGTTLFSSRFNAETSQWVFQWPYTPISYETNLA